MENDSNADFELQIVAESNIAAIKTIEKLFPEFQFKELRVNNGWSFKDSNVYTIKIHGLAKKTKRSK